MKIDLRQELKDLHGEAVRIGTVIDNRPIQIVVGLMEKELSKEDRDKMIKAINDFFGKPLTLCEVVLQALIVAQDDDKGTAAAEVMKRNELARKLNKLGKVSITEEQRKIIEPRLYKRFSGAEVAPQADVLLQGKPYILSTAEPDSESEPESEPLVEGAPATKALVERALEEETYHK